MNIIIKQEQIEDYKVTEEVVKCAFANAEHSDKSNKHLTVIINSC